MTTAATSALDDLVDALTTARVSVFRFEGHQEYDDALWDSYRRGEAWESDPDLDEWCGLVKATRARGASWDRVRLVTTPITPYTAWEVYRHFPHNMAAGEDIRIIHADTPWPVDDFWLIDDTRAWVLTYDADGAMTVTALDPAELWKARGWRDRAIAAAVPQRATATA